MEQSVIYIGAGLLIGLGAIGSAVGLGVLGSKLIESIARQPELRPFLLTNFFIVLALVEAIPIISMVFGWGSADKSKLRSQNRGARPSPIHGNGD